MHIVLISRPGISLLRALRESETAWDAIRFYEPFSVSIGVYIPVSSLAGAISLTSDLRFFLRKFTADHLFQIKAGMYCTAALTRNRYLNRDFDFSEEWPYRLGYWIGHSGIIIRKKKDNFSYEQLFPTMENIDENNQEKSISQYEESEPIFQIQNEPIQTGYLFEVWCTKQEYEIV